MAVSAAQEPPRSTVPSGGLLMPSRGLVFTAPDDGDGDNAHGLRFGPSAMIQPDLRVALVLRNHQPQ